MRIFFLLVAGMFGLIFLRNLEIAILERSAPMALVYALSSICALSVAGSAVAAIVEVSIRRERRRPELPRATALIDEWAARDEVERARRKIERDPDAEIVILAGRRRR